MSRFAFASLLVLVGCATTPQDGSFGAAAFAVNGESPGAATAFAVPVYVWNNDSAAYRGYDIVLVAARDVPVGSACNGSYPATKFAELDVVTSQQSGDRADLPMQALPVLAAEEDNVFDRTGN